jgi:hypothetical protein
MRATEGVSSNLARTLRQNKSAFLWTFGSVMAAVRMCFSRKVGARIRDEMTHQARREQRCLCWRQSCKHHVRVPAVYFSVRTQRRGGAWCHHTDHHRTSWLWVDIIGQNGNNKSTTNTWPINTQGTVVTMCTTCFNIRKLRIWPTQWIFVFHVILIIKIFFSLNNINRLAFLMFSVKYKKTEFLNIILINFTIYRVKRWDVHVN